MLSQWPRTFQSRNLRVARAFSWTLYWLRPRGYVLPRNTFRFLPCSADSFLLARVPFLDNLKLSCFRFMDTQLIGHCIRASWCLPKLLLRVITFLPGVCKPECKKLWNTKRVQNWAKFLFCSAYSLPLLHPCSNKLESRGYWFCAIYP